MKVKFKTLFLCIAVPLALGGIAAFFSRGSMRAFAGLDKPPLSVPGWLFPVVWTILYVLMGIASYLVLTSHVSQEAKADAIKIYALQLLFNFLWTFWFFNLQMYFFAFVWLVALLLLVLLTTVLFSRISKAAGLLLIPYLLWITFAGYLNLGIALLNR